MTSIEFDTELYAMRDSAVELENIDTYIFTEAERQGIPHVIHPEPRRAQWLQDQVAQKCFEQRMLLIQTNTGTPIEAINDNQVRDAMIGSYSDLNREIVFEKLTMKWMRDDIYRSRHDPGFDMRTSVLTSAAALSDIFEYTTAHQWLQFYVSQTLDEPLDDNEDFAHYRQRAITATRVQGGISNEDPRVISGVLQWLGHDPNSSPLDANAARLNRVAKGTIWMCEAFHARRADVEDVVKLRNDRDAMVREFGIQQGFVGDAQMETVLMFMDNYYALTR